MNSNQSNSSKRQNNLDDQEQFLINNSQSIPQDTMKYLKKLEGDCRIKTHHLLKVNYLKIIFLASPFALTIVGLILLYQFQKIRLLFMFSKVENNPTYIYVVSSDGIIRICKIHSRQWKKSVTKLFCFQELFYQIIDNDVLPLAIRISDDVRHICQLNYLQSGLAEQEARHRLEFYGRNEHVVKIPTFYGYIFSFFFLSFFTYIQYLTIFIYILESLLFYGCLIIAGSLIGCLINYYLIRKSYQKIKEIAQKQHFVSVLREGKVTNLNSSELVPGDLYFPKDYIPCDSIIVKKDLFVSEVGFTGETIPVGKFSINDPLKVYQGEHWAYEGSQIVSVKEGCLAVVVNTGYSTRKGRIIRKILNKKPEGRDFFVNVMQSTSLVLIGSICAYAVFYNYMFGQLKSKSLPIITLGMFVVQSIPSVLPIFVNFAYAILLIRLRKNAIFCIRSEKTTESSRIQTICFDKTGTLTENRVQIQKFLLFNNEGQKFEANDSQKLAKNPILNALFATCHSVQQISGRLHGDEIDIRMFQASKAIFTANASENVIFGVELQQTKLQVLRVNQFQSKFQSMSVLVRDKASGQLFLFAKGSPEKLHALSQIKYPNFANKIKQLSLDGYRTIAVSVKRIESEQEFKAMMKCDRQACLKGTELTALVTFSNKLKEDAAPLISTLQQADIATKIITGDNIFVAIQTALTLQMVPLGSRIIALQGEKVENGGIRATAVRKVEDRIEEEQFVLQDLNSKRIEGEYLAMDLLFVKNNQQFFLQHNCTVFARATPQLKAIIIKKEKEKIQAVYNSRSFARKLFGGRIKKVAMVGDGANDLMAIREANIGIGIIDSDAIYSADFTISLLSQIQTIIRQGKAGEQKLIETIYFQRFFAFSSAIIQVLGLQDMSIIAFVPSLIKNIGFTYILIWFTSFTPPADKLTKYFPSFNLIGAEYLLTWWGSVVILAGGQAVAYLYYYNSSDFIPNPNTDTLNGDNKSGTIFFLTTMMLGIFLFIAFANSKPFKKPLYKNTPVAVFLPFAFILTTFFFFFTQNLQFLHIHPIARHEALIVYLISIAAGTLIILYTMLIRSAELYKDQFPKKEKMHNLKLKQLSQSIA